MRWFAAGTVIGAILISVGHAASGKSDWDALFAQRRDWWSLQPVRSTPPPAAAIQDWAGSSIDCFLADRMAAAGVPPAPRAEAATLMRRLHLVLTGLPPDAGDVASFVRDAAADPDQAYVALVDRLLASPQFGERFARHWLDVVRFTETHGNEWNYDVPYAWRYRDYVIRAFNGDLPYDQFIREHIAGDLAREPRWNEPGRFNESAIGTAFFRFGEVNHDSCVQFPIIGYDLMDNQLDTLTKAFQASTVACARCHDHKLDPISTRDYHALLGVLRSSRSVQRTLDHPDVHRGQTASLVALKVDLRAGLASVWRQDLDSLTPEKLRQLDSLFTNQPPPVHHPLRAWHLAARQDARSVRAEWLRLTDEFVREQAGRREFNRTNFVTLADFRPGIPAGWNTDGLGLRDGTGAAGDFTVATSGSNAVGRLLPAGLFTFAISDRLNGALRSPELGRTHGKVSFEIVGGRFSLSRLVFNNCQLNYNHQHSFHHDEWSWVTIDFPTNTAALHPYAELLTFWDNPKFPDPLGTLGKDTENQRKPFSEHAKNPRTWWGIRRAVLHDSKATPQDELDHLDRLYAGAVPSTLDEVAARYAEISRRAVDAYAQRTANDGDVRWLDWLLKSGVLSNRTNGSPHVAEWVARYREIEGGLRPPTMMPGLADEGEGFAQPILPRGDPFKPGPEVPRGYVQVLSKAGQTSPASGSGRRELAEIIADPKNPLTARVMVNRVWQWVFGRGLVATPDDFGHLGEKPSHLDLLDHLSARFINDGWSVKALVRSLVLTRAFQGAAAGSAPAHERDPENILLSHFPARRMEAEVIRDSLLKVSGRLDPTLCGTSIHPYREKADPEKRLFTGPLDGEGRRSLYLKSQLMEAPHFLRAFNLPGGKVTQGRRDASNVPAQSLAMLNDPFVIAMAERWSDALVRDGARSVPERLDRMFRTALSRPPTAAELGHFGETLRELADAQGVAQPDQLKSRALWKDAAHLMFNMKEFIFVP